MWTHLNNSAVRQEASMYVFNAYFVKDDSTELNTGIGFDHNPSSTEIADAVTAFQSTLG